MRKKILVVDSSETIRSVCSNVLIQAGYDPVLHSSGERALAELRSGEYELLLLATETEDKSGHETMVELRKQPQGRSLPVLLMIGSAELVDTGELFEAGPDMTLNKPFSPQQLLHKIDQLLNRSVEGEVEARRQDFGIEEILTEESQDSQASAASEAEQAFLGLIGDSENADQVPDRPQLDQVDLDDEPASLRGDDPLDFVDDDAPHDYAWFVKEMGAENPHAQQQKPKAPASLSDSDAFDVEEIGTSSAKATRSTHDAATDTDDTDKIYLESAAEMAAQATGQTQTGGNLETGVADDLAREFVHHLAEALAREIAGRLDLERLATKLEELAAEEKIK